MDLFDHLERYPDHPGYQATDTSYDAAVAIESNASHLQRLSLDAIRASGAAGMTMEECADAIGHGRHSVQPRLSELRAKSLISDGGLRRKLASGRNGICWVIA